MKSHISIGPAGWSYPDWDGIVYPERKPARFDPLEYLSSYFSLIEINSTFYRIPAREVCARWVERVVSNPSFLFSVKAYQGFTHGRYPADRGEIDAFKKAISPMHESGRLAAVLVQFPWSFRPDAASRAHVRDLSEALSPLPIVVEVRHGGWAAADALSFFRDEGLCMCGIDQPVIGDSLRPDTFVASNVGVYFRLHGRNYKEWFKRDTHRDARYNYFYSDEETSYWSGRIAEAAAQVEKVFVVTNNHFRGQAVANALELEAKVHGTRPPAPSGILRRFPRLQSVLTPDDRWADESEAKRQMSLFEEQEKDDEDGGAGDDR